MTPEIEIRLASLSQASLLAEIHAASFGAAAWSLEQIKGSLTLATTRGWVAIENDKLLGFILCQMGPQQIEILTFAVDPSAQKRGIGEKLAKEAIRAAQQAGAKSLFLEVAADNEPARRLYKKLGFRETGARPGYYRRNDSTVDAVFYEKSLSSQ